MSEKTGIEWTDHTFNIAWGCVKVSPGCQHCYADTLSKRYGHDVWGPAKTTPRRTFGAKHWAEPLAWNRKAEKDGVRRRVFCSSMCDVFEDHPTIAAERAKLWPLIKATPHLDWQLLTKRPERIRENLPTDWDQGYANVWLGTSIESQDYIDRYYALIEVPARVRFISAEPLLGPLALPWVSPHPIQWLIIGGESGPGHREMDPQWVRVLVTDATMGGIAVFVKQDSGPRSGTQGRISDFYWSLKQMPEVR